VPPSRNFTLICGQDDYLVDRAGKARFEALAAAVTDELSREVISGFAGNGDEVAAAVARFREAVQTVAMFGGQRAVWLKDVNFLGDTVTGRAETTLGLVEDLRQVLEGVDPAETRVLITAAPVDRRRSFPKWCEKHADFVLVGGDEEGGESLAGVVLAEAKALGATLGPGAVELLLAKVGANSRLLIEEVRKLSAYAGAGGTIEESHVAELSPNAAEGDFFEAAEAFGSGDLRWTLAAFQRHFFAGGHARPVIAALQNRNRLLVQVRALLDSGEIRVGPRGVEGLPAAAAAHREKFGEAAGEKSSFNVFAQNPWYLGKLAGSARLPSLRRLIDNQQELIAAFEAIVDRPHEQEEVMRDFAIRCLAVAEPGRARPSAED
jgi:DNA polymerase-3 subunit delta